MSDKMALKIAVDLVHVPSRVWLVRSEPLPEGVLILLRVAAGDEESEQAAVAMIDRSPELIRKASMFFIQQILFAPDADSYRVLGSNPQATPGELRRNVALLLRWLHPDLDPQGERSVFIGRVTAAWNSVKTPERRAAYDDLRQSSKKKTRARNVKLRTLREHNGSQSPRGEAQFRRYPSAPHKGGRVSLLRRALAMIFHRVPQ